MNIIETLLNITYVYLVHVAKWPPAPIIGFASAAMTLGKTALYWLQEYYCGYCAVGHNTFWDLIFLWVVPNGCGSLSFVLLVSYPLLGCGWSYLPSLYSSLERIWLTSSILRRSLHPNPSSRSPSEYNLIHFYPIIFPILCISQG